VLQDPLEFHQLHLNLNLNIELFYLQQILVSILVWYKLGGYDLRSD